LLACDVPAWGSDDAEGWWQRLSELAPVPRTAS
jgi:hypothetical protein